MSSTMKVGVVTFPGSNCDADARHAATLLGAQVTALWHKDTSLPADMDLVILPGGFSYGDYLRTGAIARFSPIMREVIAFAEKGGLVFGVCNGFQILCEAGLLPGALTRNHHLKFICKDVWLRTESTDTPYTSTLDNGQLLRIPIAHGEGCYVASEDTIRELEDNHRVVFRYVDAHGEATGDANPNGSMHNIAGVVNARGNVLGMMPHPERAAETILGSSDGMHIFESIKHYVERSTVLG